MAGNVAGSSSSTGVAVGESSSSSTDGGLDRGETSGWVEPLRNCPHLAELPSPSFPPSDSPCAKCHDPDENWTCLVCQAIFCGRYINGHMLEHSGETGHAMAISFRDLSVWCFKCESYLDAQVIPVLRPVYEKLHILKFGEALPPRQTISPVLLCEYESTRK